MVSLSRKIIFNVPSLLPEAAPALPREGPGPAAVPGSREPAPGPEGAGDTRKLAMLVDVSEALTGTLNLQAGLYGVLEVLQRHCGALRGAIALLEDETGMLAVEAALGYPQPAGQVRYRIGEGVTGMVAQSGVPAVVPG